LPPPGYWPAQVFAPYADMLLYPTFQLAQTAQTTGMKYYTLAFIVNGSSNCQAAWGGVIPLDQDFLVQDISDLRNAGGDVIVSFGGANSTELAIACSSVAAVQAQYQAVIDKYNLTAIDYDVEGNAETDSASIDRRSQAMANLQAAAKSSGKTLKISLTLPVLPSGLDALGLAVLQSAVSHNVDLTVVNVMAMDYGSIAPANQMGTNATQAATSLYNQLKSLYPAKSSSQLWAMIGVTPMIGLNDVSPEDFTLQDAQQLLTFAQQNGVGRLAMWSIGRDQSCPNNAATVSSTCSGITQSQFAFGNIFKQFTTK
jgi:hypothetical protein